MADLEEVFNWKRWDDRITTSGQPSERHLVALKELGVGHVINLGLHSHEYALADEAASLEALGIQYTHIPVEFSAPTDDDFQEFCAAMERLKDEKLHIHCIANYRVSAFMYRYCRDVMQDGEEDALSMMAEMWTPEGVWADFIAPKS